MVTTTLRSRPCGRGGVALGVSPAAMRLVQSAYISSARVRPTCVKRLFMAAPAWPARTRRSHASTPFPSPARNIFGISRVALLPIWWQPAHPSTLTMFRIHSPCERIIGEMPLPLSPVPGKSLFGGICSMANQYCAG